MRCRHHLKISSCDICREKTEELLTLLHEHFLLATISEETLLSSFTLPQLLEPSPISCIGSNICFLKIDSNVSQPIDLWRCVVESDRVAIEIPSSGTYSVEVGLSFALTALTSQLVKGQSSQTPTHASEITLPCTVSLSLFQQDEHFSSVQKLLAPNKDAEHVDSISEIPEAGKIITSFGGMSPTIGVVPTGLTLSTCIVANEGMRLVPALTIQRVGSLVTGFNKSEPFIVGVSDSISSLSTLSHFKLKCLSLILKIVKIAN